MFQDKTFEITFFVMGVIVFILALRSISFSNQLEDLKKKQFNLKGQLVNEWTKLIMDDVDEKIAKITSEQKKIKRGKDGKFTKQGGDLDGRN